MSVRTVLAGPALAAWRLAGPLLPRPDGAFRILLFHDVPGRQRPAFAALVDGLARRGLLIGPEEAESRLAKGGPASGPVPVLLSFDDGFASNLEVAETILAPLGARALFFVCPGLAELSADAQDRAVAANILRGLRPAPEPLMDWDGISRLKTLGHAIGSHTRDHLRLADLGDDQLAEQVEGAAAMLNARLGEPPRWFAYTFGDIDSIDARALAAIGRGHAYCRSGVRGLNGKGTGPLALRGDHVDLDAPPAWRALAAEGALAALYARQRRRLDALGTTGITPGKEES